MSRLSSVSSKTSPHQHKHYTVDTLGNSVIDFPHTNKKGANMVTVYSKPNCPHCNIVKANFKKHNVQFNEVNIAEDAEALNLIKQQGFTAAPVVMDGEDSFSGADAQGIARFAKKHGA